MTAAEDIPQFPVFCQFMQCTELTHLQRLALFKEAYKLQGGGKILNYSLINC